MARVSGDQVTYRLPRARTLASGYVAGHEEADPAADPHRTRSRRGQEAASRLTPSTLDGGGSAWRRFHHNAATPPATSAVAPTAVGAGGGVGTRSRSRTGRSNLRTSHPRSRATRANSRSGLTTTGWPTASSIGRSVAESEYAHDMERSMPSRWAIPRMAPALLDP